jgi:hypothetical protein
MRREFGGHFEKKAVEEGKDPADAPHTNTQTSGADFAGPSGS